jgi:hypothetical protein
MAACPKCYYPITKKAMVFESDYTCPNCNQRLVPQVSSVLLSILLLLGIPSVTIGLFAFVFGIDSLAMMIGFFVLVPFGIYAGRTMIRYEPSPEEPVVAVTIQPGANCLDVHGSEEELNMAAVAPAFSPRSYTWTFPGCPIQIRIRLEIVDALQRLVERAQNPGTLAPFAGGLLLGDTASPGVTEVAGIEPLAGLDVAALEAAIGKAECEVVGFFRAPSGDPAQAGASLRMTDDDVTLASGFFNQPSSVVLLIETVETAAAKAAFFFWDGGKMLGDFSFMDFPLDAHQLAALERQRTAPRGSQQFETEINLEAVEARASREEGRWPRGVARTKRPEVRLDNIWTISAQESPIGAAKHR